MASNRCGPQRQDAADDLVGNLGRREVEHSVNQAGLDELLHGLSAGARGVKHQAFEAASFQNSPRRP